MTHRRLFSANGARRVSLVAVLTVFGILSMPSDAAAQSQVGTLVGNAFAAMGIAIALYWLEQFSVSGWVWAWFVHSVLPGIQSSGNHLLGTHRVDTIKDWFAWYGANQLKFNFWIIYLAAICDDLGIPNLKSLARLLVQRVRNRQIRSSPSDNSEITPAA